MNLPGLREERITAVGSCYGCSRRFRFDPDRVPSVYVDPDTGLPPEADADPTSLQRRVICPTCAGKVIAVRSGGGTGWPLHVVNLW